MRSRIFTLSLLAGLLLARAGLAAELPATAFPVPKDTYSDSGYTALIVGLDGQVYLGTAWYGGSAHLVRLNPATGKWDVLINAHQLTRDTGTGLDSQSKFHAKLQVGADGLIWAATKQGNEEFANRPEYGESETGFKGGHLFSYNPKSGEVIDHGILMKQEGLMGGAIDDARKRLYYCTDPKGHFLIYDIATNTVRDLGRSGPAPRYMAIDDKGRVFWSGSSVPGYQGSCMAMYDPQTDKLYQLGVIAQGGEAKDYANPYVIVAGADKRKIFGVAIGGKYVEEYDLASIRIGTDNPYINGTIVCRLAAAYKAGDTHAGTVGLDGCFYFNDGNILYRYNPKTSKADELGTIAPPNNRDGVNVYAQGAASGPDGTLYMKFLYPYQVLAFDKLTAPAGGK